MRALVMAVVAAAGFAAATPTVASAADGCGRGRAWNGYRCVWIAPRAVYVPPVVGFYGGRRWHGTRWHGGHRHHWRGHHHHRHHGGGGHHRRHR